MHLSLNILLNCTYVVFGWVEMLLGASNARRWVWPELLFLPIVSRSGLCSTSLHLFALQICNFVIDLDSVFCHCLVSNFIADGGTASSSRRVCVTLLLNYSSSSLYCCGWLA